MDALQLELPKAKPKPRRKRWKEGLYFSGGYVWRTMPDLTTRCLGTESEVLAKMEAEARAEPQDR